MISNEKLLKKKRYKLCITWDGWGVGEGEGGGHRKKRI